MPFNTVWARRILSAVSLTSASMSQEKKRNVCWAEFPICDLLLPRDRPLRRLVFIHVRAVWIRSRAGYLVFNVFLRCLSRLLSKPVRKSAQCSRKSVLFSQIFAQEWNVKLKVFFCELERNSITNSECHAWHNVWKCWESIVAFKLIRQIREK